MTLPKEAELLGANSGKLEIRGSGAETVVSLNADASRNLAASLADASGEKSRERVYVVLENIRGTHDATALNVYINVTKGASLGDQRDRLAGSLGLYGLRRASVQANADSASGLEFVLDITGILTGRPAAKSTGANEIRVSIVPHRKLPDSSAITIGRVSIFRQRHEV
jgi:tyrosinase